MSLPEVVAWCGAVGEYDRVNENVFLLLTRSAFLPFAAPGGPGGLTRSTALRTVASYCVLVATLPFAS